MSRGGTYELLTDRGPAAIAIVRLTGRGVAEFVARHVRTMRAESNNSRGCEQGEKQSRRLRSGLGRESSWNMGRVGEEEGAKSADDEKPGRHEGGMPSVGSFRRGRMVDETGAVVDEIIISVHRGSPEPEAWLHVHGGRGVVAACVGLIERAGFAAAKDGSDDCAAGEQESCVNAAGVNDTNRFEAAAGESCRMASGRDETRRNETSGSATAAGEAGGIVEGMKRAGTIWSVRNKVEAEVFRLLPRMVTLAGARWLLRQSEILPAAIRELSGAEPGKAAEACRAMLERGKFFEWFAKSARIALIGPPNAGKSTLLNAMAGRPAALVSEVAGTTRDWVEAAGEIGGYPATWIDTAGLREATSDPIEEEGMRRSVEVSRGADAVVVVLDGTSGREAAEEFVRKVRARLSEGGESPATCVAVNKADLFGGEVIKAAGGLKCCAISALTGWGLDGLCGTILGALGRVGADLDGPAAVGEAIEAALRRWPCGKDIRDF